MDKKVWLVTGASKGLGLALINRLLREGQQVATLEADPADEQSVADSIRRTYEAFGRIDVVVNNAGYGLGEPIAHTITVIQKVMPRLRAQRSGHIINIAPITGVTIGTPHGHVFYTAARQATLDLSTTLADDVSPLGIRVTTVLADGFHTGLYTGPHTRSAEPQPLSAKFSTWRVSIDGRQPGDPNKAAAALLRIATADEPPSLVYLTSDAYKAASEKMILFGRVIASQQRRGGVRDGGGLIPISGSSRGWSMLP